MYKAGILFSGGLDSTTALALAVDDYGHNNVVAISVKYGQKHIKETMCAKRICEHYKVKMYTIDLSYIFKYSNCALLQHSNQEIKHTDYSEQTKNGQMVNTYVPFRNGLMLAAAASLMLSIFPDDNCKVIYAAHKDDVAGEAYPDCSERFFAAQSEAIYEGSGGQVKVDAPFINWTKKDIVSLGLDLQVPYEMTWSCYEGKVSPCGKCATCRDRIKAFEANEMEDPLKYENNDI